MTPIEKLRALEAQATPGPWMFDNAEGHLPDIYTDHGGKWNVATTNALRDDHVADARLIAATRTLLPELMAVVEAAHDVTITPSLGTIRMLGDALDALDARAREEMGDRDA